MSKQNLDFQSQSLGYQVANNAIKFVHYVHFDLKTAVRFFGHLLQALAAVITMTEILIIGFILILAIALKVHERRLSFIKDLLEKHSSFDSKNINWVVRGCYIIDSQSNTKFWDGISKIGVSDSGVHFSSIFVGNICIPWNNLKYSKKAILSSFWFPWLNTEISSNLVNGGLFLTNRKVHRAIEKTLAANKCLHQIAAKDAAPGEA